MLRMEAAQYPRSSSASLLTRLAGIRYNA